MALRLVLGISLAIDYIVADTEEIRHLLADFVNDFYRLFYCNEYERLRVCKYTIHSVLHISDCIEWWGPASHFWQYPEERFCGTLVSAVKSRVHGSTNLSILMYQQQLLHIAGLFGSLHMKMNLGMTTMILLRKWISMTCALDYPFDIKSLCPPNTRSLRRESKRTLLSLKDDISLSIISRAIP
jgi:hypothetical protein